MNHVFFYCCMHPAHGSAVAYRVSVRTCRACRGHGGEPAPQRPLAADEVYALQLQWLFTTETTSSPRHVCGRV